MIRPAWSDMIRSFGRIGLLSFGGPAAQIALMHDELVTRRGWLGEQRFLGTLSFCMLLPGPEAMQLATFAGWRLRGLSGGLLAGLLFVLPGAIVIAALAFAYAQWGALPVVREAFTGVKALVIVIVMQALWKLSRRALDDGLAWGIAGCSFLALFLFDLPFPLVIALAAGLGAFVTTGGGAKAQEAAPEDTRGQNAQTPSATAGASWQASMKMALGWLVLWLLPLAFLWAIGNDFLFALSLFFAKLAVVTFGGAYAVLAYMAQEIVTSHGWLTTEQMIDALGLAETTPGPLILVTQFAAHLAGLTSGGGGIGLIAGLLALWMVFVPCFLFIFVLAPHVEKILSIGRLRMALRGITAAVVGVILNLSLWFALHVLFGQVEGHAPPRPVLSSFSPEAAGLTLLAAVALLWLRLPLLPSLGVCAALGAILAGAI
ncbi:chromate efflux transporter [Pseudooceanicola sp. C21-150M6]|uniref:chromate efflux transporter n=1 Tax=Pseudooceanicola sp. C21-150M6 TaxID=3434355 RepID=UPI003D7F615B